GERGDDDAPPRCALAARREPRLREHLEPCRLPRIDGLHRRDERAGAPRLHLDEEELTPVTADEIDLPVARPNVARDDPVPALDELAFRDVLARDPEDARLHMKRCGRRGTDGSPAAT